MTVPVVGLMFSNVAADDENRKAIALVEVKRGDLCCYLVYHSTGQHDPRAISLLAKMPRFLRRSAIARSESLGADRVIKDSA